MAGHPGAADPYQQVVARGGGWLLIAGHAPSRPRERTCAGRTSLVAQQWAKGPLTAGLAAGRTFRLPLPSRRIALMDPLLPEDFFFSLLESGYAGILARARAVSQQQ